MAELDYLLSSRIGVDVETLLLNEEGAYRLESFGPEDVRVAIELIDRHREHGIGLADASIVVIAARAGTNRILTLDERHFRAIRSCVAGRSSSCPKTEQRALFGVTVDGVEVLPCSTVEKIGVRELRQHASRWLARVAAGESFEVTDRGQPVAWLVPTGKSTRERLMAAGQLIPADGDLLEIPPLRHKPPLSSSLEELRAEES